MGMNWGMSRGDGRMTLQMTESSEVNATSTLQLQGLAGWVMALLRGARGQRVTQRKLQVVETLSLGGKRQLMLVTCAGESFLVGGGLDSVETIVRVNAECSVNMATKDEICR
jgi:flagellar biogenesis protein FliO